MEKKKIFGLVWGQLAIMKKNWRPVMRAVFTCLHGSKIGLIKRKIP